MRATVNLGDRSAEILRFVAAHPQGVRAGDVAAEIGMPAKEAGVYLGRLLDAGRILRPERGRYTSVGCVVSVVPESEYLPNTTLPTQPTPPLGASCEVCSFPLAAALVTAGETTHPTCLGASA